MYKKGVIAIAIKETVRPTRCGAYFYKILYNPNTGYYRGDVMIRSGGLYKVIANSPLSVSKDEAIHFAKRKVIWVTKHSKGLY